MADLILMAVRLLAAIPVPRIDDGHPLTRAAVAAQSDLSHCTNSSVTSCASRRTGSPHCLPALSDWSIGVAWPPGYGPCTL